MEVTIANSGLKGETAFLSHIFTTGTRFSRMIDTQRKAARKKTDTESGKER